MQYLSSDMKEALRYLDPEEIKLIQNHGVSFTDSENQDLNSSALAPRPPRPKTLKRFRGEQQSVQQAVGLSILEKEVAFLKNELAREKKASEIQMQRLEAQRRAELDQLNNQLRLYRARTAHSEGQIPLIKEALSQVRDMLAGLVPESVYLRLRDIPDRDLPASEWLLVNVWELVQPTRRELDNSKREVQRLREEVRQGGDKQDQLLSELEHYSRLLAAKDDDEKRHLLNYENSRKTLQLQVAKCRDEIALLKENGFNYDLLLRDFNFCKQEKELIEERLKFIENKRGGGDSGATTGSAEDFHRKLDLLRSDKEHLTKQNIELLEKNRRLEDRIDRYQKEVISAKNSSEKYLQQLLTLKSDSAIEYERKLSRQIQELNEKRTFEVQNVKTYYTDLYEKQIRFLKEAKEDVEGKYLSSQAELRDKARAYDQLLHSTRAQTQKLDLQNSEFRVALSLKSEELDRLRHLHEEALTCQKTLRKEVCLLQDKLDTVKGEYYRLEATNREETAGIRAQLAMAKEQVANYELIEKEIDGAVIALGEARSSEEKNVYIQTLASAPSSSKRRIQQSMNLAQKLASKQRDYEASETKLILREKELEQLKEELRIVRSLLEKSSQPNAYLISGLEEKEQEVLRVKQALRKREEDYQTLQQEHSLQGQQLEQSENDVKRLLVKREQIQSVQNLLLQLAESGSHSVQVNSLLGQIQEVLGQPQTGFSRAKAELGGEGPRWFNKLKAMRDK